MNLAHYLTSDSLIFVDVPATIGPPPTTGVDSQRPALRAVYDFVRDALGRLQDDGDIMVLLDDITSLEWIGFPLVDLVRFSRALRSLCFKVLYKPHNMGCIAYANFLSVKCIPHYSTSRSNSRRTGRSSPTSPSNMHVSHGCPTTFQWQKWSR